jgi:hypothetical protein
MDPNREALRLRVSDMTGFDAKCSQYQKNEDRRIVLRRIFEWSRYYVLKIVLRAVERDVDSEIDKEKEQAEQ